MNRMWKIVCCMAMCAALTACSSSSDVEQPVDTGSSPVTEPEAPVIVYRGDTITRPGNVEVTWTQDYDPSEWADSTPVNLFVRFFGDDDLQLIENKVNHYLQQLGKNYYLRIISTDQKEFLNCGELGDSLIHDRSDGTVMDLYLTMDYKAAVAAGEVLDLTDFLLSPDGQTLYARYDEMVWAQLRDENGRIYGVPSNPIATTRPVYLYYPQVAEQLSIDIDSWTGDIRDLESICPRLKEMGVLPLISGISQDPLLLSLFGLENYGDIFAIRHNGEDWEAVNFLEDDTLTDFYCRLGQWHAEGYLDYFPATLQELGASEEQLNEEKRRLKDYSYRFLELQEIGVSSFFFSTSAEGGSAEAAFYVPRTQAYITEDVNNSILVINADTTVPDACRDLLSLLRTDTTLMRLLYCGIEHYHYQWQDGYIIYRSAGYAVGLGFESDRRFLNEASEEQFTREFDAMNYGVGFGLAYSRPCEFADEELAAKYQACKEIIEENLLVFQGYYGEDTASRLETLKEQLYDAGYQELLAAINSAP